MDLFLRIINAKIIRIDISSDKKMMQLFHENKKFKSVFMMAYFCLNYFTCIKISLTKAADNILVAISGTCVGHFSLAFG